MLELQEARARVQRLFPEMQDEFFELLKVPSVNAEESHREDVAAAAAMVLRLSQDAGLEGRIVQVDRADGYHGAPAVIARTQPVPAWPTVLLYAHHDVQPVTGQGGWDADPFDPVLLSEVESRAAGLQTGSLGRVVARGSADDKGGIVAHLGAIRALADDRQVNIVVLFEGEEEIGSPTMPTLLDKYGDELRADAVIVIDGNMWRVDVPMMTASMRGLLVGDVTVQAFVSGLHSGGYGGPVLDANVLAARLISSFHDDQGLVAVEGLDTGCAAQAHGVALDSDSFRNDATLLEETRLTSAANLAEQLWVKPSIAVIGADVTPTASAAGTLAPSATFRVSLRLPPDLDPVDARDALVQHLEANRPFGAQVTFEPRQHAKGYLLDLDSAEAALLKEALEAAWDGPSVAAGVGGTVPLLQMLAQNNPDAAILKVGSGDPDSKPHGQNESASLDILQDLTVALVLFMDRMGSDSHRTRRRA